MKKFFSFACALFASVAAFAIDAPTVVPSTADFNGYKADGANVVVGFYTEAEVCNDIVFTGTYNSWSSNAADCAKFEAMEGFTNWYVVSFADASENICGKPVQLKSDGSFAWDYQIGDDAIVVSGTATISAGYSNEVNIEGYGTDAPVVIASHMWKQGKTPCVTVPKHNYTIVLDAPFCADAEGKYFDPAIIGAFNGWAQGEAMVLNETTMLYSYTINDEEGHEYKFKAATDTDWSNQIQLYNAEEDSWYDNPNLTLPVATGDTTITIDYSAGRYTLCVETTALDNVEAAKDVRKVVENGRLVIYVGEDRYNVLGTKE